MNQDAKTRLCTAILLILSFSLAAGAGAREADDPEADRAEALSVLKQSTDFLSKLQTFNFTFHCGYDVVQEDGQKLEFGAKREVTIQRPDRVRVDFERRNGVRGGMVFDGKAITVFNASQKVYAQTPQPEDLDAALDYVADVLGLPVPLRDFLSSDSFAVLTGELQAARYLGKSTVAGVPCDHVALRTDHVDYQVWIAGGDSPLPWRVKITYKHAEGQPQFWAQFVEWKTAHAFPDSQFTYTSPEDAERIPFAMPGKGKPASGEARHGKAGGKKY